MKNLIVWRDVETSQVIYGLLEFLYHVHKKYPDPRKAPTGMKEEMKEDLQEMEDQEDALHAILLDTGKFVLSNDAILAIFDGVDEFDRKHIN